MTGNKKLEIGYVYVCSKHFLDYPQFPNTGITYQLRISYIPKNHRLPAMIFLV